MAVGGYSRTVIHNYVCCGAMWLLIISAKLLFEIALMALVGRWALSRLLAVMGGAPVENNLFFQILDLLSRPWLRLAALCCPHWMLPRHHGWVAFAILAMGWLTATYFKINWCLGVGVAACV